MTIVRVIDTETAGHKLPDDAVIEIGSIDLDLETLETANPMETLVDPSGVAITDGARGVHHITDEMLEGAPAFSDAIQPFCGARVYCAHRMTFDKPRVSPAGEGAIWLCTWKLALRAFPDQAAFGLQTLVKRLPLTPELPEGSHAHRALYDAVCTAALLKAIAETLLPRCEGVEDFLERSAKVSAEPGLLRRLRFGQHKYKPIADVPTDYLEWMVAQADMNADAKFTADHELKRRLRGARSGP